MPELRIVDHSRDRYHSLAISSVWELARIRKARVLVVGAGALGNEVCKNLAMMGVKQLVVLDRDTVEAANLSRSVFFRQKDHGRPKTEAISERLRELNPDVEIVTLTGDLDAELGLGLVRHMDLVFSCLDSRLARRSVNRMCGKVGKAWVDGAMEDLLGEVAVYIPGQGPCYECGLSQAEKTRIAEAASCRGIALRNLSLGKVPTTPTMGSIIAALQVQEGVKVLHGDLKKSLAGKRLVVNSTINDFYVTTSDRNEECEGHEQFGEVREVPEFLAESTSAKAMLERFKEDTGEDGFIELGREVVVEFRCPKCERVEVAGEPIRRVDESRQRCPECGTARELATTHTVKSDDGWADWTLSRVGIPRLDVLEVRGGQSAVWYELSGDRAELGIYNPATAPVQCMEEKSA
jgi:molybdopterin/thiamine biosynthesis adenylyltransferase